VAISALLVIVMLGLSATFIALTYQRTITDVPPIGGPVIPNPPGGGGNTQPVTPAFIIPVNAASMSVLKAANFNMVQWNRTAGWMEYDLGYTLGAEAGSAVLSAYKGVVKDVVLTGNSTTGMLVRIDHGNGLETVYSSLAAVEVTKGQTVEQGTRIGIVGNTAFYERFEMPHVRFEAYENGKPVNPEKFVDFPDVGAK